MKISTAVFSLLLIALSSAPQSVVTAASRKKPVGLPVPPSAQQMPQGADEAAGVPPANTPVLRTTYSRWLNDYFAPAILSDSSKESTHWGRNADPDGDGSVNQLEYFAGTSPIAGSPSVAPQVTLETSGGDTYLFVTFARRKALSDPNFAVEIQAKDDLQESNWSLPTAEFVSSNGAADPSDPIEVVTYRFAAPVGARTAMFARLRVTALLTDSDGDGLADAIETGSHVFKGAADPGTDANVADSDGDGINDGDETLGTFGLLNLPQMGCNPLRRNILIEYDWFDDSLECALHSHRPSETALNNVAAAFAASPNVNPDGTTGIFLIQDRGDGGIFNGGNRVSDQDSAANIAGGVSGAAFFSYKGAHFAANRVGYFHYCLLPHRYNSTSNSSGQAEINGDDLIVSLYCFGSDRNVAHTIMHELGHNLGLRHGGDVDCNYKPNYNSVMNYRYQFPGANTNCAVPGSGLLAYSPGVRIELNELALDESKGVCGNVPIDWDEDGTIELLVTKDINSQDTNQATTCGGTLSILRDFNDWGALFFGGIGDSDGRSVVSVEVIDCDNPPPLSVR